MQLQPERPARTKPQASVCVYLLGLCVCSQALFLAACSLDLPASLPPDASLDDGAGVEVGVPDSGDDDGASAEDAGTCDCDAAGACFACGTRCDPCDDRTLVAMRASGAIVIDGVWKQAEWAGAHSVGFSNPARSDNTVRVWAQYDTGALYFAVRVDDPAVEAATDDVGNNDAVEIFLDPVNDDSQSMDANDAQIIIDPNSHFDGARITAHAVTDSSGYMIEGAIPWSELGIVPTAGDVLGLLVGNDDREDGQRAAFDWLGLIESGEYSRPYLWGDLVLAASTRDAGAAQVCPSNLSSCAGACVDLDTDASNCGKCGHACQQGLTCESGACGFSLRMNGGLVSGTSVFDDSVFVPLVPYVTDGEVKNSTTFAVDTAIAGTVFDGLYQTESYLNEATPEATFTFPVPNGDYTVHLHFVDWVEVTKVGDRVYDIVLQGETVLSGLDIVSEVGHDTALIKTFDTTVVDQSLTLTIVNVSGYPEIAGVEIVPLGAPHLGQEDGVDAGS